MDPMCYVVTSGAGTCLSLYLPPAALQLHIVVRSAYHLKLAAYAQRSDLFSPSSQLHPVYQAIVLAIGLQVYWVAHQSVCRSIDLKGQHVKAASSATWL